MRMIAKLFSAFCVATIIAQLIILGMMAAKGNLRTDTFTQVLAVVNGIDVTGHQVENAFRNAREMPLPTHDEVLRERAQMSLELQNSTGCCSERKRNGLAIAHRAGQS
jgi:hypothetical protein